ncbi:hypothetical protein [Corynebacterium flavescens]|uniref:hypothetical protein n=1 Tax=Corynebacterium flavescens TaxID=28028 RepID=UPI002648A9F5|nr:hypothetical protein [Corynebacterium flavescens]MDN6199354.1 hypothetical protein [Corynebacterium flavescens]MDN6227415.1 hypothetical protein [Corynebacterium flavescens]MDN6654756.1 hypothetical protein [Bifidobacterium crudilactis]
MAHSKSHDEWWAGLADDRKAQIRRWLSGKAEETSPIPGQLALMKIEKGEGNGDIQDRR